MTNAILRGKPDAGNPHVRFDEGEVASAKPRRGPLLYKYEWNANCTLKAAGRAAVFCAAAVLAGGEVRAAREAEVTVDPSVAIRPMKPVNATNNGPLKRRSDQTQDNFEEYKMLEIPYARIHDTRVYDAFGGHHCADISGMFPDFSKDETDPKSWDFTCADEYLLNTVAAGAEPFFQFGETIEHWIKKFMVNPPPDFNKWARLCERVIMHYNEGWANGQHLNIRYWEIWNEPDCRPAADGRAPNTWTGTEAQFHDLYEITAKHLKKRFPHLKIGGPAVSLPGAWSDRFIAEMRRRNAPMDFFSWHCYHSDPTARFAEHAARVRKVLDANGFTKTESILNEWNYVRGWSDRWTYSLRVESGDLCHKGAAFIAHGLMAIQNAPIDMGMYYDARPTQMNGLFDGHTQVPIKGYYAFQAWSRLRRLGTQVKAEVTKDAQWDFDVQRSKAVIAEGRCYPPFNRQIEALAARDVKTGTLGVLVGRYSPSDDVVETRYVTLRLAGGASLAGTRCYLTDATRAFTEVPYPVEKDGSIRLKMTPNSFVYVETAGGR